MVQRALPSPGSLRRLSFGLSDAAVSLGALGLLALLAKVGAGAFVSFTPPHDLPQVSLDPRNLPYYAGRSTLRMFIVLAASFVFTYVYGYAAARSRYAERVLVPLLDILQSVPVLGFLSITVTGFIALFPGSLLGLEAASIFAIFTAQAWNMAFSFYQSLRTLPGIGSYVAAAVTAKDMRALGWAVLTMAAVIFLVDQLFWRPLVAWSDKFLLEQSAAAEPPQS